MREGAPLGGRLCYNGFAANPNQQRGGGGAIGHHVLLIRYCKHGRESFGWSCRVGGAENWQQVTSC